MQGLPQLNFGAGDVTRGISAGVRAAESKSRRKLIENREDRESEEFDSAKAGLKAQRMISVLEAKSPEHAAILNAVHFPKTKIQWQGDNVQLEREDGTTVFGPKAPLITMQKMQMAGADPQDVHQYGVENGVLFSNPKHEAEAQFKTLEAAYTDAVVSGDQDRADQYLVAMGELKALEGSQGSTSPPNTFEAVLARQMGSNVTTDEVIDTSSRLYGSRPVNTLEGVLARQTQGSQSTQGPIENAAALTSAKKTAEVTAGKTAEAKFDVGKAVDAAEQSLAIINQAINHPGRETATGKSGVFDPRNYIPGTDATNFQVVLDQLKGKAFLQAFQSLKGGGQITEAEGQKATDAMARLNRKQSDAAFLESLQELMNIVQTGVLRARQQASGLEPAIIDVGTVEAGYKFLGGDPGDPKAWEKVSK